MTGALANHLWQSTMFAVLAGLVATALRDNRAQVRYWLWFTASLKFVVPFSLLVRLGNRLAWAPAVNEMAVPAVPAVSLAMRQVVQPFSDLLRSMPADQPGADQALVILLGGWVCGAIALAIMRLRRWRLIRAAARASVPWATPAVGFQTGGVQIRSAPGLSEPAVVGVWRPVLMVPASLKEHLATPQLEAVLAHELCHVRRRDNLGATIHMIVETVFWFHPLVWWIGARLVEERERACDEHVLRVLGDPQAYAEGILRVCRLSVESRLACVSGMTGSNLERRIEDIMANRIGLRLNFARGAALAIAAVFALGAPVVVGLKMPPVEAHSQVRTPAESAQSIRTKEAALRDALLQLRQAIDRYHSDKNQYPHRLDLLVSDGYMKRIPTDPFTRRSDSWQTIPSKADTDNPTAGGGIFDVRSGSRATATDGTRYADW
jgi:beta-lactamase regulating signal transducer with metallopeptidase domain